MDRQMKFNKLNKVNGGTIGIPRVITYPSSMQVLQKGGGVTCDRGHMHHMSTGK